MPETISLFCGSDEPQKAFPPFMLAAAAVAMDMKVTDVLHDERSDDRKERRGSDY